MDTRGSGAHAHLDLLVPPAARNLVGDKVDAVHLVRVPGEVDADLVRLEVPQLCVSDQPRSLVSVPSRALQGYSGARRTFKVESFDAETSMRESDDHEMR